MITVRKMVTFKCKMNGRCCTRYWIPITHLDALRLVIYGNINIYNAVELKNAKIYKSTKFPPVKIRRNYYYLSLREVEGTSTCIFLSPDGRCLVHEYKPLTCRFYPFVYTVHRDGSISISVNEKAIGECPGLVLDGKPIDEEIVKRLVRLAKVRLLEIKLYKEVVHEWNSELNNIFAKARNFIDFMLEEARKHKKMLESRGLWVK
ncbi:MAG: hypothetical protein DRZ82_01350 [Thermoprotei archaeon]|nr:MAG: hypothetical protein DRZ82_01350 [Thermoprotei archaeon]